MPRYVTLRQHRQVNRFEDLLRSSSGDAGIHEKSPCRRCSGRCRRHRPLVVACRREGDGVSPAATAKTDSPGPSSSSSTWNLPPNSCAKRDRRLRARPAPRQTQTPLPAASPSSLRTHGLARRGGKAFARAVATPAASITSLANHFEPSICAAAALGPKTKMPAVAKFVRRGRRRAAPRAPPRTRSILKLAGASETSADWLSARTGWQCARGCDPPDCLAPGAQLVDARAAGERPRQARARDPHPRRAPSPADPMRAGFEVGAAARRIPGYEPARSRTARVGGRAGSARGGPARRPGDSCGKIRGRQPVRR